MLAPERAALVKRRKTEFPQTHPGHLDFMPADGRCWSCHADLVEKIGKRYPRAFISWCPCCNRSFDD